MELKQPENNTKVLFKDLKGAVRVGRFIMDTSHVSKPANVYIESGVDIFREDNISSWAEIKENITQYKESGMPHDKHNILFFAGGELNSGEFNAKGQTNFAYQNYYGPMCGGETWTRIAEWFYPEKLYAELERKGEVYKLDAASSVQRPLPKEQYMSPLQLHREQARGSVFGYDNQDFVAIVALPANATKIEPMTNVYVVTGMFASTVNNALAAFKEETNMGQSGASKKLIHAIETAQTNAIFHGEEQSVFIAKVKGNQIFNDKTNPNMMFFDSNTPVTLTKVFNVSPEGKVDLTGKQLSRELSEYSLG